VNIFVKDWAESFFFGGGGGGEKFVTVLRITYMYRDSEFAFLGAFAKLRNANASSFMSAHLSVSME